jgi:hypothetical protein
MKATLEFNLPEDEAEFYCANKGTAMLNVLWELKQELRSLRKYAELKENQYDIVEKIEDFLFRSLEGHEINLDK